MLLALTKSRFERDAAILSERYLKAKKWTCNSKTFPVLDITFLGDKPIRLRLNCEGWNELPPAIELLGVDGSPYTGTLPGGAFNPGPHDNTKRPFVCHQGSREYHTHTGHLQDKWAGYRDRDGFNLIGILDQLCTFWRRKR